MHLPAKVNWVIIVRGEVLTVRSDRSLCKFAVGRFGQSQVVCVNPHELSP
jgi:hypothetical protein